MGNIVIKMVKTAMLAFVLSSFAVTAEAVDTMCEAVPDCLTLGYEKDIDCPAGTQIYCPYDVSYKKCVNAGCVELGYTLTNKLKWCKNIVYCPTDSSYTLCAENCTPCSNGELEPDCVFGVTLAGLDGCGHQCYTCRSCSLDIESGYTSAKTECNLSSYVISMIEPLCSENYAFGPRYVCGSCPEGTAAQAVNSASCACNESAGYYATCPNGAVCDKVTNLFGACYRTKKGGTDDPENDGCKNTEGWVLSSTLNDDIHFTYGETSIFNIGTGSVTCKKVTGCNLNVAASTTQPSELNATYFSIVNKKVGQIRCYWIDGCKSPYTTSASCSEVRVLANSQTQGGFVCGTCSCDEFNNYFNNEPTGSEYTIVDGCYHKEGGCANPYTDNTSDTHFTYGEISDCTEVTGCRSTVQGSTLSNTYDTTYFDVKDITNAGVKCYYVDGCKSPYLPSTSCATGQKHTNTKTAYSGGITCGNCVCDSAQGYYDSCPSGAACEQVGSCYKTKTGGTGDNDGDGCKESEGWVSSSINDSHFTYGTTSTFNIGAQTHTCKKVTGCSSVDGSTTTASNVNTTYFTRENATYGGVTCYWATGCSADYRPQACTASEILQDGPRAIATYTCYKCESQSCNQDGYYLECPAGATCVTETIPSGTCQKATGCKTSEGWYQAFDLPPYYTWGESSSFKGISPSSAVVTFSCKKADGCNESSNYYSVCPTGRSQTSTFTAGDVTCLSCDCNSTDGYYATNQESVVTTVVNGCYKNTGTCNETNSYYPETTWGSYPQFSFGSAVTLNYMDGGSRKLTSCKKLTGCNTTSGYQSGTCGAGEEESNAATLGSYTCRQCGDCTPPTGTAVVGGCPTGYKSGSYNSSCGGTDYYNCECDETKGYYSPTPSIEGTAFAPYTPTGYPICYLFARCKNESSWFSLSSSEQSVFSYSQSSTVISHTTGQPTNCYRVNGCESPYVNRACNGSEQEFTSTNPTVPNTLGSYTCRYCRSIPSCTIPQVCSYVSSSIVNGSLSYSFNKTGFNSALDTYKTCMGEFDMSALTCSSFGGTNASSSIQREFQTPSGVWCYSNPSGCATACDSSLSYDATTTEPGAGCSYSTVTINGSPCYYNITTNTCSTTLYPWNSGNLPLHSEPVAPFCVPGRADCSEDESQKRYTDFRCVDGYHKDGNQCKENDCDYMNLINGTNYVASPDTDYDCQYRQAYSVDNGAKTITCYSPDVDDDYCNLTCGTLGYQPISDCNPEHNCQTCNTENVTNDFGENLTCWTGTFDESGCRTTCEEYADYYDVDDCDKDYNCQTCTTATFENDLGENITCWDGGISDNNCRTTCDDFPGYSDVSDCSPEYSCQVCETDTFTSDLGNNITCWNGNIRNGNCRTTCEDYSGYYDASDCSPEYSCQTCSTSTFENDLGATITCWTGSIQDNQCRVTCEDLGYYTNKPDGYSCSATTVTNDLDENITCFTGCANTCSCEARDYKPSRTGSYTEQVTYTCGGASYTCWRQPCTDTCETKGYTSSYVNCEKPVTVKICGETTTCYENDALSNCVQGCQEQNDYECAWLGDTGYYNACCSGYECVRGCLESRGYTFQWNDDTVPGRWGCVFNGYTCKYLGYY